MMDYYKKFIRDEYEYKFTKNKERESTAPSWLRDIIK